VKGYANVWKTILGVIFAVLLGLFAICFVAIVIEETFLGGRRRRRAEKALRERNRNGSDDGSETP
jgi:hypothetical protein